MSKKKPITEEDAIRIAKAESKKKPQKNSFTKRAKKAAEKNKKIKKKPITEEDAIRIAKAESKKKPQKNSFAKRAKKAAKKNKKN